MAAGAPAPPRWRAAGRARGALPSRSQRAPPRTPSASTASRGRRRRAPPPSRPRAAGAAPPRAALASRASVRERILRGVLAGAPSHSRPFTSGGAPVGAPLPGRRGGPRARPGTAGSGSAMLGTPSPAARAGSSGIANGHPRRPGRPAIGPRGAAPRLHRVPSEGQRPSVQSIIHGSSSSPRARASTQLFHRVCSANGRPRRILGSPSSLQHLPQGVHHRRGQIATGWGKGPVGIGSGGSATAGNT